jgi:hypothetical protein
MIQSICVFCGSSLGNKFEFQQAAHLLGQEIAQRGLKLVYGAGNTGLMGVVANTVLEYGGYVIGVIPHGLVLRESAHTGLSEEHVMNTMHERKALMSEKADAYVALPGGFGTYEELFEVITWAQLGIHHKPIVVLNIAGYFDPFIQITEHGISHEFIRPSGRELFSIAYSVPEIFEQIEAFTPALDRPKWLSEDEI